jgi:hypothetical protein
MFLLAFLLSIVLVFFVLRSRQAPSFKRNESASRVESERQTTGVLDAAIAQSQRDAAATALTRTLPLTAFGWGSDLGQLGREQPAEGNPEGPMSFAINKHGTYLLDQVNARVLIIDPQGVQRTLPATKTMQDLAVAEDGTLALLDRQGSKRVTLLDSHGRHLGDLPLEGSGLDQAGLATGVFFDGKDVYAEREHGALVRLGRLDGTPASEPSELSGRPSKDGTYLAAAWKAPDARRGFFYSAFDRAAKKLRFTRVQTPKFPLAQMMLLDTDMNGTLYVGVQVFEANGSLSDHAVVYCYNGSTGEGTGQARVPLSELPDESFKDSLVTDDGEIITRVRSTSGVTLEHTRCAMP